MTDSSAVPFHVYVAHMTVLVDLTPQLTFHASDFAPGVPVATLGDFASFAVLHKEFTGGERSHIVLGRKIS